jgi:hypothetical protein
VTYPDQLEEEFPEGGAAPAHEQPATKLRNGLHPTCDIR